MSRLRNFTHVINGFNNQKKTSPTDPSENELLAQMEIFVIVVAVIAVAAAIILLVLLQLRIKKQTTAAEALNRRNHVPASPVEEIALDYPADDQILNEGPPPYRQVMQSPELYPLAPSINIGNGDVKIQIPTSPVHNQRTKRTWNQFLNAVLRSDDQGLNTLSGKYTSGAITPVSKNSYIHNSPVIDEVLPTYDEVRSGITTEESKVECSQKPLCRRDSADIVKSRQYNFLGFNFGIEKTKLCKNDCVFTTSYALQTVITEEKMRSSTGRPRLATM